MKLLLSCAEEFLRIADILLYKSRADVSNVCFFDVQTFVLRGIQVRDHLIDLIALEREANSQSLAKVRSNFL